MEDKEDRVKRLGRIRAQRYRDAHKGEYKPFKAEIPIELYEMIDAQLKADGISKIAFLEGAIKLYLANKKSEK